jgi:hypothetical protein
MENVIQITNSAEFTRHPEVLGVYYTSLPQAEGSSLPGPLARITIKESEDVYETSHEIAKEIELIAFPLSERVPAVEGDAQ